MLRFQVALRSLGLDPNKQEIKELARADDTEMKDDFTMDVNQFIDIAHEQILQKNPKDELRRAFRLMDKEKKGYVDVDDLQRIAEEMGEPLTTSDAEHMLSQLECVKSGDVSDRVSEEEFVRIMSEEFE